MADPFNGDGPDVNLGTITWVGHSLVVGTCCHVMFTVCQPYAVSFLTLTLASVTLALWLSRVNEEMFSFRTP